MTSDGVVKIENLTKIFTDFWKRPKVKAVDDVSLEMGPGMVFGLLGPNGSGKSTTLKILLGLLHPTRGNVLVLGRPPRDVGVKESMGYLPEESYVYPYLTPRESLSFYARLFDLERHERETRIEQLLDMVNLRQAADRPVGEFSKGMSRRLGLAQALINDPQLVLLDEPTSGLDPMGCRQVKDLIQTLARRGKTIVLSSHLLADVEDVCDQVAILYRGRVRARGTMHELLEKDDRVQMTIPALPPASMQTFLQLVRKRLDVEPVLEHPRMDLEQFFLDVIEQARRTGDGDDAGSPDALAGYLQKGDA